MLWCHSMGPSGYRGGPISSRSAVRSSGQRPRDGYRRDSLSQFLDSAIVGEHKRVQNGFVQDRVQVPQVPRVGRSNAFRHLDFDRDKALVTFQKQIDLPPVNRPKMMAVDR